MVNEQRKKPWLNMSMDMRDKDLDRPPGMPPRPGEEQSEGEGALECVVEERDEECKFSL